MVKEKYDELGLRVVQDRVTKFDEVLNCMEMGREKTKIELDELHLMEEMK
jgi:hypothetical protein